MTRRPSLPPILALLGASNLLLGVMLFAAPREAGAQPIDSLRTRVADAVAREAGTDLDLAIARLRREAIAAPEHVVLMYDLGYALHRRAAMLLRSDRREEARKVLEEADRALGRAVTLGGGGGALALRGTVTGQLAGVSGVVAAMRLEPLAYRQLDEALALAPDDPRVALLNGIARLDAPRAFGGGEERAERELRRAIRLFANDSAASPAPSWGRVDAHIWLGIALARSGRRDEARESFERALLLSPEHVWVRTTLLPQVADRAAEREPIEHR